MAFASFGLLAPPESHPATPTGNQAPPSAAQIAAIPELLKPLCLGEEEATGDLTRPFEGFEGVLMFLFFGEGGLGYSRST